jgi:hypothetical protein
MNENQSELRPEDIQAAIMAGLAITNPDDERIQVPMRHAAGVLVLREILARCLRGQMVIAPTQETRRPAEEP